MLNDNKEDDERMMSNNTNNNTNNNISEQNDTDNCGICLCMKKDLSKPDKCIHTFCFECLQAWSNFETSCPLCKCKFGAIERINENDNTIKFTIVVKKKKLKIAEEEEEEEIDNVNYNDLSLCIECNNGHDEELLLLCDGCDGARHTFCFDYPLPGVPQGDWYCETCRLDNRYIIPAARRCSVCFGGHDSNLMTRCDFCTSLFHIYCNVKGANELPDWPVLCAGCANRDVPVNSKDDDLDGFIVRQTDKNYSNIAPPKRRRLRRAMIESSPSSITGRQQITAHEYYSPSSTSRQSPLSTSRQSPLSTSRQSPLSASNIIRSPLSSITRSPPDFSQFYHNGPNNNASRSNRSPFQSQLVERTNNWSSPSTKEKSPSSAIAHIQKKRRENENRRSKASFISNSNNSNIMRPSLDAKRHFGLPKPSNRNIMKNQSDSDTHYNNRTFLTNRLNSYNSNRVVIPPSPPRNRKIGRHYRPSRSLSTDDFRRAKRSKIPLRP